MSLWISDFAPTSTLLSGLIEDEDFRLRGEPASESDLLLVAAGECGGGSLDGGGFDTQSRTKVSASKRSESKRSHVPGKT